MKIDWKHIFLFIIVAGISVYLSFCWFHIILNSTIPDWIKYILLTH